SHRFGSVRAVAHQFPPGGKGFGPLIATNASSPTKTPARSWARLVKVAALSRGSLILSTRSLQRIPVKLTRSRRGGSSCRILHEKVSVRKHRRVGIEYEWSARKTFADRL